MIALGLSSNFPRKSKMSTRFIIIFLGSCAFSRVAKGDATFPVVVGACFDHTCAVLYGHVLCWGNYQQGALGPGFTQNVGMELGY